jgi:hypothetical protein
MEECKRKYVALSYTWGNPVARREIVVNGKPAFITENLYAALTHMLGLDGLLGSLLEDCELWIDALCINQQDAAEKFVQVANMRDVFANAGWVVAWMGPSADGSDELLRARVRINYTPINDTPPLQCNCTLRNQSPVELIHRRLTWEWMQYIAVAVTWVTRPTFLAAPHTFSTPSQ